MATTSSTRAASITQVVFATFGVKTKFPNRPDGINSCAKSSFRNSPVNVWCAADVIRTMRSAACAGDRGRTTNKVTSNPTNLFIMKAQQFARLISFHRDTLNALRFQEEETRKPHRLHFPEQAKCHQPQ